MARSIAIGAQSGFSWKGVGLSALGGGIGGGVTGFGQGVPAAGEVAGQFEKVGGIGGFLSRGGLTSAIGRGIATNALTQGIGVATGLQSKFDFAGVAAAGIGAGAADFAGARTASWGSFGSDLATGMASALANAATRSAVSGNSFGDNLIAALPDVIGGAIGRAGARGAAALADGGGAAGLDAAGAALGSGAVAAGHLAQLGANPTYQAGTFDADGFNTSLISDSLVALGADMPAGNGYRLNTGPIPLIGDEIVVVSNPHIGYLLDPVRMSSERFAGYLSATGGVNSHYWAHKFQNQHAASSASRTPARSSADDHWGGARLSPYETGKRLISSFVNGIVQTARSSGEAALTVYLAQSNIAGVNVMARARVREMGRAVVNGEALQGAFGQAVHVWDRAIVYDDLGPAAEAAGSAAFGGALGKLSLSAATARVGVAAETTGSRIIYDAPIGPVRPHKNSLSYVGDTHVYVIRRADGSLYKVGESAQGVRVGDGASIRAEQQARALRKETGENYRTEIRQNFGGKADARAYETRFIQTYERLFGQRPLGNPLDR